MKKKDFILISIICVILLLLFLFRTVSSDKHGDLVRITENGSIVGSYPLSEDRIVNLTHNTVTISNGEVFMSDADCPDRLCIRQGAVSGVGQTIACLPNRVTVEVISGETGASSSTLPITYSGIHFDTVVQVTVYDISDTNTASLPDGKNTDPDQSDGVLDRTDLAEKIRLECDKYELICSRTNSSSELYLLNHDLISGKKTVTVSGASYTAYKVSEELYDMIKAGVEYGETSDGLFDIAIAPLSDLWDFKSGSGIIPDQSSLDTVLPHLSYKNVILLDDNYIAFTDDACMIDLGGLAKGYIGDRLRDMLTENGVTSAIISLGGNVVTIGDKGGEPFTVGIRKPFGAASQTACTVKASDGRCVITSGTYERCFTKNGTLYHHILDPSTGYPYATDLSSATVICDSSLQGDILSTVLLAEGSSKAIDHAKSLKSEGISVILMDNNGKIIFDNYTQNVE